MNVAVSWRKFSSSNSAFETEQLTNRNSLGLEITKNLGDYHGFVPFIGPCLSYERLSFQESFQDNRVLDTQQNKPALGVVFGWDILPNRFQHFVLRTNLRYFPNLNLDLTDDQKIAFDNIEFNFIQLVIYPERVFGKW